MINIYLGDSLAAMRAMDDNTYDIAIVDPPYGLDRASWFGGATHNPDHPMANRQFFTQGDVGSQWDKAPPPEYFEQLRRVSRNQIVWGGNYFAPLWAHGGRCVIAWDKRQPWPNFSQIELAWTSYNKPAKLFKYDNRTAGKIHPTQKPVALYQWCLDTFAKKGDRILDTHLGSGSIAIACHNAGYALDAWEVSPEYHANAVARFNEHTRQLRLF